MIPGCHGGNTAAFAAKYGLDASRILDFSSCLNPLGPPEGTADIFAASFQELTRYPDPSSRPLKAEMARHYPIWPENVAAGAGATAVLDAAVQVLQPRKAVLLEPGFSEYRRVLNRRGVEIRGVLLEEKNGFRPQSAVILNALRGQDLLILGHPGNPAGTALERDDVDEILREAARRDVFVIVDESHVEWTGETGTARDVRDDRSFLVLRSLSRFYALPGLRIGFALGARKLISRLESFLPPWPVGGLASRLGIHALQSDGFREKSVAWLEEESRFFLEACASLDHFRAFPSRTNYFLMRIRAPWQGPAFLEAAAREGIYLRRLNDAAGIDNSFFRAGLRLREDNNRLLEFLRSYRPGAAAASGPAT